MNILFCNNPFDTKKVDPDFEEEFTAAKEAGLTPLLFSFEELKDGNIAQAASKIKASGSLQPVLYRGWMLKPKQYALLYDHLLSKNYKLINSPAEYQNCHYLPDSYRFIETHTPTTIWMLVENGQVDYDRVFSSIEVFGDAPLVIKDYVKSQKHYWDTACFIPSAGDREKVKTVIENFVGLQGNDLNEGLVIREFVALNDLAIHSKSKMPLKQENRLFFFNGQLIACYDYWEEGEYTTEQPPLDLFSGIAKRVESNFFSMDIAKTKNGQWLIIELGDGQVAGLPDRADKLQFYQYLREKL